MIHSDNISRESQESFRDFDEIWCLHTKIARLYEENASLRDALRKARADGLMEAVLSLQNLPFNKDCDSEIILCIKTIRALLKDEP
jgi:hypothetical protein